MGRVIVRAGYRKWAQRIFAEVDKDLGAHAANGAALEYVDITDGPVTRTWDGAADLALFYGWSSRVPDWLLEETPCYGLHPSPLPRYRGGSPLQHQIIAGEYWSAVTIFEMTDEMDAGPIFAQVPLTLDGSLDDVFDRIVQAAISPTIDLIRAVAEGKRIVVRKQPEDEVTSFMRRHPGESEITLDDLAKSSARQIHDKVRALYSEDEDYPTAYITCGDGICLYLTGTNLADV